jgi:hypothetical protein
MDSLLLFLTYFFAAIIIGLALYFLYCWNKDQELQDNHLEQDNAGFDIDLVDKSNDRDSNLT